MRVRQAESAFAAGLPSGRSVVLPWRRMSGEIRSFGPYQLVRRLGMGGMAETFEAMRTGPGGFEQRVCVKRILPTFEQDEQFVRLFLEEARVAARLRHANIVQVIDFGLAEGSHYLALELVVGCDLREVIRAERTRAAAMPGAVSGVPAGLTSGLVAFIAQELAVALEVAHGGSEPIVHRDISPANVLLSTAGEVKLSDFGIARAIGNHHATATSTIKGKVPYMAPEYAMRGHVDRRVDLFALGVLLYECLAGVRPFDGTSDLDTLHNIERGAHIRLRERCPNAPSALVDAIEQLILPDPNQRIQSATALLDALVDVAPPPTARRILGELVTRTRGARSGGDASGTVVDALANTSIAPSAGATLAITAERAAAATPSASAEEGATIQAADEPAAPRTAVLDGSRSDAQAPALPFASAASADVTRTAAARSVGDGETRAAATRTNLDPARAVSDAVTRMLPRGEQIDAGLEPNSGGTLDPPDLRKPAAQPAKRGAPIGLIALGSVALIGSAALILVLVLVGQSNARPASVTTAVRAANPIASATTPVADVSPRTTTDPQPATPLGATAPRAQTPVPATPAVGLREAAQHVERTKRREQRAAALAAADEDNLTTRALLSVVSDRGGDIYIDGRRAGPSPLSVTVPPGRHVLANGSGDDAASLTIDIGRGERRRVVLR